MTKMATMPIYSKTLKNLPIWNLKANDLEPSYVDLTMWAPPKL